MSSPSDQVKAKLNACFGEILHEPNPGVYKPYICTVCDKLLQPGQVETLTPDTLSKSIDLLAMAGWNEVSAPLKADYTYTGEHGIGGDNMWIKDLILSPRGCYITPSSNSRRPEGFSTCEDCNSTLKRRHMPKYAIANNYMFGTAPDCLTDLTDIELAMLTPVKTYGYIFTYTGGKQKK
jgi:hypothetical protein